MYAHSLNAKLMHCYDLHKAILSIAWQICVVCAFFKVGPNHYDHFMLSSSVDSNRV